MHSEFQNLWEKASFTRPKSLSWKSSISSIIIEKITIFRNAQCIQISVIVSTTNTPDSCNQCFRCIWKNLSWEPSLIQCNVELYTKHCPCFMEKEEEKCIQSWNDRYPDVFTQTNPLFHSRVPDQMLDPVQCRTHCKLLYHCHWSKEIQHS